MAKINAINNKSGSLTIDPGASGDSYVQFDINTTGEFRIGVDDDATDAFKISQGSALGTNDTFVMSAAGERTMPLQPSFCAYASSTQSDVTGNNTSYTTTFDTEVWDQTSDYDTGTGIFTAPCDGKYLFTCTMLIQDLNVNHTSRYLRIDTSNRRSVMNGGGYSGGTIKVGSVYRSVTAEIDMDSGDTAYSYLRVSGSTKTVDVYGEATNLISSFAGALMC